MNRPTIETYYVTPAQAENGFGPDPRVSCSGPGWYWRGLCDGEPTGDPVGPFDTEDAALRDAED